MRAGFFVARIVDQMRQSTWFKRLGWILFAGLVLLGGRLWQQAGFAEGAAPPLAGILLDGTTFDLNREPAEATLVYFWASWCPDCTVQQDAIDAVARDHAVITVAMKSGAESEVRGHLAKFDLRWRVLNDPRGDISRKWGVRAVPAIFIVDSHDNIRFHKIGYTGRMGLLVRLWFTGWF